MSTLINKISTGNTWKMNSIPVLATAELMDVLTALCCFEGEDQLLIMTRDFDPLNEVSLYQSEFGEGICQPALLIRIGIYYHRNTFSVLIID